MIATALAWFALAAPAPDGAALFARVHVVLAERCASCHGATKQSGGLSLASRERMLAGGKSGPAIEVGDAAGSLLVELVEHADARRRMPKKGPPLAAEEVADLRAWIDAGAEWPAAVDRPPAPPYRHALAPPRLPLPAVGREHPLDRLLALDLGGDPAGFAPLADDRRFARRAHFDVLGLPPSPADLAALETDPYADRRERLVDRLLADRTRYAEHWLTFWNDLLRNDYVGTGYIDGGRTQITTWLYRALEQNLPFDAFARALIAPGPESAGFVNGITWRGTVSASQVPPMQAAEGVAQVFLGVNLKCASCHDSFVSRWKLDEAYAFANVFAAAPLEVHRCDLPQGRSVAPAHLWPELGAIDAAAPLERRREQLAGIIASPENGRFARTIVNRVWARCFGRGLVEPLDDMDAPPFAPAVLEWLAQDFVDHGFDSQHLLRTILTSRAYQLQAAPAPEREDGSFAFRGPIVRRLGAEPFVDAVAALTGEWYGRAAAPVTSADGAREAARRRARWIWSDPRAAEGTRGGRIVLRRRFALDLLPERAVALVTCDNEFRLIVNGRLLAESRDWQAPAEVDLAPALALGDNEILVEAVNWPDPESGRGREFGEPNAAGFYFHALIDARGPGGARAVLDIASDAAWECAPSASGPFAAAAELGSAETAPWGFGGRVDAFLAERTSAGGAVRAALVAADRLQLALDRPNREQVVSRRPSVATTLQALELTNGSALHAMIRRGAERRLAAAAGDSDRLIEGLWRDALVRAPSAGERALAQDLLGAPAAREGAEDLLWSIVLLPEFQLVD